MKITKRQLKRIIREEMEPAHQTTGLGANIANADFPISIGYQGRSEIVYNEDALDDLLDYLVNNGVPYSLDPVSDLEPEQVPIGAGIEELEEARSARKLTKIIRETRYMIIRKYGRLL